MKSIICQEPKKLVFKDKTVPRRGEGEVLLRVRRIGVCGTDLHAYSGNQAFFTYPRILGHEIAAEVIEVNQDSTTFTIGDKVIVMPYISCGTCIACRNGKRNCCTQINVLGVHIDGGMQEIISLPEDLLIPANNLSFEEIAIVEPLAIGAHALRRADLKKGETIVVIGCGPIGIGIMKLAQIQGAKVIAVDVNKDRLSYVKEKFGIDHTVNALVDPLEKILEITDNDLATAVFDASGNKQALEAGIQFMSHGGRYILVGLSKGELTFNHPEIHSKETTLMCSRNATHKDFEQVVHILSSGNFPLGSYITHKVSYRDMIDRFDSLLEPENRVIKAVIEFD